MSFLVVLSLAGSTQFSVNDRYLNHLSKPLVGKEREHVPCLSLDGNWRGTCIDSDGEKFARDIRFDQSSCDEVVFYPSGAGMPLKMHGQVQFSQIHSGMAVHSTSSFSWNLDGTRLNFVTQLFSSSFSEVRASVGEAWEVFEIYSGRLLSSSNLVTKDLRDIPNIPPYKFSCNFSKE